MRAECERVCEHLRHVARKLFRYHELRIAYAPRPELGSGPRSERAERLVVGVRGLAILAWLVGKQ